MIQDAPHDSGVYLLHFSTPFYHAKHYVGYADDIARRVKMHRSGTSRAKLTEAVVATGRKLILARVWIGKDRYFERNLKNCHKSSDFCPICNPDSAMNRMKGN